MCLTLRNNAKQRGYYNQRNLYFELMTPNSTGKPTGKLAGCHQSSVEISVVLKISKVSVF